MGEHIRSDFFSAEDEARFRSRLAEETTLLREHFEDHRHEPCDNVGGLELEAWLVDEEGHPVPTNASFLETLGDPDVVPEIGAYNIEFNGPPAKLTGDSLTFLHDHLEGAWGKASQHADRQNLKLAMIGMLPSLEPDHLHLDQISNFPRYWALNDRILALRSGRPIHVHIEGDEVLDLTQDNVMLEAALTSFQVHIQTSQDQSARLYNAGVVAAGLLVAATCNSAYVFGHPIWQESRIPVFEQVFNVEGSASRVSLGSRYAEDSLMDIFEDNLREYSPLLPSTIDAPRGDLRHLRLHNGTIWRWVRPVVDVVAGRPLLRIEHRVIPAGPTVEDCMANAVLAWGLSVWLAGLETPPESTLPFASAQRNLATAAHFGLDAELDWIDGGRYPAREILSHHLGDIRDALRRIDLDPRDVDRWIGHLGARFEIGQTGASWQRRWAEKTGLSGASLMQAYLERQATNRPVHRWSV